MENWPTGVDDSKSRFNVKSVSKTFLRWSIVYKVTSSMQSLRQDVHYGMRLIKQSPLFAAVTVITLALGIGANTAMFGLLDALVLRNLPLSRPDRLVEVAATYRNGAKLPFSFPVFQQLQENQRVFSNLFGWTGGLHYNIEVDGALFLGSVRGVTGNYYSSLGATPLLGRFIRPEDTVSSRGAPVAVIGYEFWDRRFGRDPAVIGKVIRIEGTHSHLPDWVRAPKADYRWSVEQACDREGCGPSNARREDSWIISDSRIVFAC
jgi:MacB-like periplasmic core domain